VGEMFIFYKMQKIITATKSYGLLGWREGNGNRGIEFN